MQAKLFRFAAEPHRCISVTAPLSDCSADARPDRMVGDWQAAGLVKTSSLKPVFTTIQQPRVLRALGHLSASNTKTLRAVITDVIG